HVERRGCRRGVDPSVLAVQGEGRRDVRMRRPQGFSRSPLLPYRRGRTRPPRATPGTATRGSVMLTIEQRQLLGVYPASHISDTIVDPDRGIANIRSGCCGGARHGEPEWLER